MSLTSAFTAAISGEEFLYLYADAVPEALIDEVRFLSVGLHARPSHAIRTEVPKEGVHETPLRHLLPLLLIVVARHPRTLIRSSAGGRRAALLARRSPTIVERRTSRFHGRLLPQREDGLVD